MSDTVENRGSRPGERDNVLPRVSFSHRLFSSAIFTVFFFSYTGLSSQ
jgi:hypothetical protein